MPEQTSVPVDGVGRAAVRKLLARIVANACGIDPAEVEGKFKGRAAARARGLALALGARFYGLSRPDNARTWNMDGSSVYTAIKKAEAREPEMLAALVAELERETGRPASKRSAREVGVSE